MVIEHNRYAYVDKTKYNSITPANVLDAYGKFYIGDSLTDKEIELLLKHVNELLANPLNSIDKRFQLFWIEWHKIQGQLESLKSLRENNANLSSLRRFQTDSKGTGQS